MAQYFREFRDLTSDHENFPHENLVCSWWAWLCAVQRSERWRIASTGMYVRVPVTFFHSNGSRRLEVSRTCLSYERHPDGLKTCDARLEFETDRCYFDSFLFTLTSPNATCKNCWRSDNVNCQHGCHDVVVITKKLIDHKIFIAKIYIHVIFSNFTKI